MNESALIEKLAAAGAQLVNTVDRSNEVAMPDAESIRKQAEHLAVPQKEKIAPVQGYKAGIPWSLHLEAYDAYSKRWAPQPAMIDLEGKNCRGGFSTDELDQFIPGWRERASEIGRLKARVAELESKISTAPDVAQPAEAAPEPQWPVPQTGDLTFSALRLANILRLPQFKNPHGELAHAKKDGSDWSPSQWFQAVVGELGEYANVRKKLERGDITLDQFAVLAAKELADVQTYLSILALRALDVPGSPHPFGVDLGEATRQKFNEVSNRGGSDVYIDNHGKVYRVAAAAPASVPQQSLADALHYPGCWDTAAYPALSDALSAANGYFKCSECAPAAPTAIGSAES